MNWFPLFWDFKNCILLKESGIQASRLTSKYAGEGKRFFSLWNTHQNCHDISLGRGILCRQRNCVYTSSWVLCFLVAHDVSPNLWNHLHQVEIPVAVGIVELMHSPLLPLCRTQWRAGDRFLESETGHQILRPTCRSRMFTARFPLFAVTPRFGDQSTAATWLKERRGSRMVGPSQSSTLWRATWGRDDKRPHLSWTRTKPSAPSPHFQCTSLYTDPVFNASQWRWAQSKNKRQPIVWRKASQPQSALKCLIIAMITN